jgi:hypothetical protein
MTSQDSIIHKKLTALKQSRFRSKFRLTQKDRDYIITKGLETIKEHVFQFVNARVAPDFPKNDGNQTPMRGQSGIQKQKSLDIRALRRPFLLKFPLNRYPSRSSQ